jgi:hypothetical protein
MGNTIINNIGTVSIIKPGSMCYRISITDQPAIKFLKWMYSSNLLNSKLYLQRKYILAQKTFQYFNNRPSQGWRKKVMSQ